MRKTYLNLSLSLLWVLLVGLSSSFALAEDNNTIYSVETDPATFAWDGYAFHLRMTPAGINHWVFGASVYSLEFPDFIVNMNVANKDKGWIADLQQGLGLFAEYYFDPSNQGWFVGTQLAEHQFRVSQQNDVSAASHFTNGLLMFHSGYRWFPFSENFYIQPWAGLGYTKTLTGSTTVGADDYDVDPLMIFATMHVGYRF